MTPVAQPWHRRPRLRRVAIELLGPPLVATVLLALFALLREPRAIPTIPWPEFLGGVLAMLVFAYLVAGVPSALFTIVMEVAFAKGLDPGSWLAVTLAAGLGLLSGAGIVGFDPSYGAFDGMVVVGLATGTLVGVAIRAGARRARPDP